MRTEIPAKEARHAGVNSTAIMDIKLHNARNYRARWIDSTKCITLWNFSMKGQAGVEITFNDKDADGLIMQHNDGLIIITRIVDTDVRHFLIDPGRLANIIKM